MSDPEIAHLELDIARGIEPISGHLRAPDAPALPFAGVLELIMLLDAARAASSDGDEGGDGR
jgi:hypothetical protein